MVMMPAVPPYSSSTTAMCARVFRRSSSTRSAGRESGMKSGSRRNCLSVKDPWCNHRSLARNTPTMSSSESPITG